MVDRYAKFATEDLAFAASRIETEKDRKAIKDANQSYKPANFELIGSPVRTNLGNGDFWFWLSNVAPEEMRLGTGYRE